MSITISGTAITFNDSTTQSVGIYPTSTNAVGTLVIAADWTVISTTVTNYSAGSRSIAGSNLRVRYWATNQGAVSALENVAAGASDNAPYSPGYSGTWLNMAPYASGTRGTGTASVALTLWVRTA